EGEAAGGGGGGAVERLGCRRLGCRPAGAAHVGGVRAEAEYATLAEGGKLGVVGLLGVDGARVELEVSRVHDGAHRRLNGEADAVGDGVGDADGNHHETTQPDRVTRLVGSEVRALEDA